ncbi:hypothetical protein CP532_1528 [Ophiocordyceps camponoti-leonardi (nom. inval.)]|nr:hypothetical protein CP532_1528 [Ophiocordyceps camponoti-leonardi (nom. inval.)]
MAVPRESFLPTIKCSSCGNQVEISMMGEHLCGGPVSPPPEPKKRFDDDFRQPSYSARDRRTPPQLNTNVANRPFGSRGQLTPVSQPDDSRDTSPVGYGQPSRSPMRQQPPGGYGGLRGDGKRDSAESEGQRPAAGGFLDRVNNVLGSGPFGAVEKASSVRRFPTRKESLGNFHGPDDRPGTGYSTASSNGYNVGSTIAPPKAPRKNGYGGFGPPQSSAAADMDTLSPEASTPSDSYRGRPMRSDGRSPMMDRFEDERKASMDVSDRSRRQQQQQQQQPSRPQAQPQQQQQQQQPPPRSTPYGQRQRRPSNAAADFGVGNPYHVSSNSASSGYSSFSDLSQSTAQTSPARSYRDKDVDELQTPMDSLRFNSDPRRGGGGGGGGGGDMPYGSEPRGTTATSTAATSLRYGSSSRYGSSPQRGPDYRYGSSPQRSAAGRYGVGGGGGDDFYGASGGSRGSSRSGSRGPVISRGDCKACGLPIKGKSISSADGRLTGKYHKACFVCTTCSEPFRSTEFYVLDDKPYCEQHYHKLNGSLCGSCGRGIEGQYVEDESRMKYHIGCFRCLDCGRSLSDGYFEVDGKAYCERDAWRRTQPPTTTNGGGYGMAAEADQPYRSGSAMGGSRPGGGGLPERGGRRAGSVSRGVPAAAQQPRRQMNKRMTRIGRM